MPFRPKYAQVEPEFAAKCRTRYFVSRLFKTQSTASSLAFHSLPRVTCCRRSDSRAPEKNSRRKKLRGELEKGGEGIRSRPPGPPPHRFPGVQFNSIPIIWYHRYERFFSRAAGIFGVYRRSKPRAAKRLTIKT